MAGKGRVFSAFLAGFFTALILAGVSGFFLVQYAMRHPQDVADRAARMGMVRTVEKTVVRTVTRTVHSIPRDEVARRQERIDRTVQNLTRAFTENRLSYEDIQILGDRAFGAAADQKITPQEIDELLDLAERMGR